jgi:hypothetical protein
LKIILKPFEVCSYKCKPSNKSHFLDNEEIKCNGLNPNRNFEFICTLALDPIEDKDDCYKHIDEGCMKNPFDKNKKLNIILD